MVRLYDFHLKFKPGSAKAFDFDGGCVIKEFKNKEEYDSFKRTNKIITGARINCESMKDINKKASRFKRADYLALKSANYEVVRYAIKKVLVDVLIHNEIRIGIDYVIAKECSLKNIAVDICFRDFMNAKNRARTLRSMREEAMLCRKYKTPLVISSGAANKWELMPKNNLLAFGEFLGLTKEDSIKAMSFVPEKVMERKKKGYFGVKGIEVSDK